MKSIRIPSPVLVVLDNDLAPGAQKPETVTFDAFVRSRLADQGHVSTMEHIFAAIEMRGAVARLSPGTEWLLDEAHYALLLASTRAPTGGYQPLVAIHLAPFMRAIVEAKAPADVVASSNGIAAQA